jgi:hypothetical protein
MGLNYNVHNKGYVRHRKAILFSLAPKTVSILNSYPKGVRSQNIDSAVQFWHNYGFKKKVLPK